MGEGWGEGEYNVISLTYPPPLNPLPPGEGRYNFLQVRQNLPALLFAME